MYLNQMITELLEATDVSFAKIVQNCMYVTPVKAQNLPG